MKIPAYVMEALNQYDACMKDPTGHIDATGRAPFEEASALMRTIERALNEAAMAGARQALGFEEAARYRA